MKKINFILIIVLGILVVFAFYFFYKNATLKKSNENSNEKEALELVNTVGKLIVLPENELPIIATVSDPEALKDQPFFAKAKVGDKVLLFPQSKRAFLYDPVAKKILEVAPINLDSN